MKNLYCVSGYKMIRRNILIFALGLLCITTFPTSQAVGNTKFREAFAWRELTFNWPNDATRDQVK